MGAGVVADHQKADGRIDRDDAGRGSDQRSMVFLGSQPSDHSDKPGIGGEGELSKEAMPGGVAIAGNRLDAVVDDRATLG